VKTAMTAVTTAVLLAAAGLAVGQAAAQAPPAWTKVTLEDIHCMGCARKIARKVTAVAGVAEMRVDLKAKAIWAVHKPGMTPSPRAIWEAVEAADHTPVRVDAPSGSHTSKPQT
jgi:copper chaperone CopZ